MTDPIRVGIAGAGFAARFHVHNLHRVHGVPIVIAGVTSRSPQTREAFARENSVPAFDTFAALCDAADVIDLCSPPSTHEALAIEALQRGKHIIVEKPFTGYFGDGAVGFRGNAAPKEPMLRHAIESCRRIIDWRAHRESFPSPNSASGCGCCRVICRPAVGLGTGLSDAAGAYCRGLPGRERA